MVRKNESENNIKKMFRKIGEYLPAMTLLFIIMVIWETAVRMSDIPQAILPPPTKIAGTLVADFDRLWSNLLVTMLEIFLGFLIGLVAGMISGIMIVYSKTMERLLYPIVIASQVVPVFAIAPLLIIWFGFGIMPKVLIASLIVFFPICVNQVEGLRSVDPGIINLMKAYKANEVQIFKYVRFPASLPFLMAGVQVGITFSVIGAVIGEWVGAEKGIGSLMLTANAMSRIDLVFASIFVLAVLGITLFVGTQFIGDKLIPWKKAVRS